MAIKIDNPSALVEAVLSLDRDLSEIVRLGAKIDDLDFKSDYDYEQAQRLMAHFTECGQGVSDHIVRMSAALNTARTQAEEAAQRVSIRAEQLQAREIEFQTKMESFRVLGEKVRDLTLSLNELKQPTENGTAEENRAVIAARLAEFELKLHPLIEEARALKQAAQQSKLKTVEQGADSLAQSLSAVSRSLESFKNPSQLTH